MIYQFHSLDLSKGLTVPSFATPAASCPLVGLPKIGELQLSKLAHVSSARYYTEGGSRLDRPIRPARHHPSFRPLRSRRHQYFRRVVPLGCYCAADGCDEVRSFPVEMRETLLPGRHLCPVQGQNGRTLVMVGGEVACLSVPWTTPQLRSHIEFAVDDCVQWSMMWPPSTLSRGARASIQVLFAICYEAFSLHSKFCRALVGHL